MKDYRPPLNPKIDYGLFLIRKSTNLSSKLISSLSLHIGNNIISFERLFKGKESALLVYAPRDLLLPLNSELDLLEMEEYITQSTKYSIYSWEFDLKSDVTQSENLFEDFPQLGDDEQFWLQLILITSKKGEPIFRGKIRAVILSKDSPSQSELIKKLQNFAAKYLVKLPKAFSDEQILDFYKARNTGELAQQVILNSEQVLKFLKV